MSVVRFRPEAPFFNECHWHSLKNNTSVLRNRKLALGNMPVAYFNQRGFFRRKSDSARRCSVGAASNPSSSQKIALARRTKYAAVAHLVERHLAKVEVASSSLVSRSKSKDTDVIRCFSFIRSTLTSSTFIKSEVGVPVKACGFCEVWMRFEPRQPLQNKKHRCIRCFLFYPNRQPLLILCRFTASP